MTDETVAAQAEGEALPASSEGQPIVVTLHADTEPLKSAIDGLKADYERVLAAVDAWYAKHFHTAAVEGRAPISAEEKASLTAHVTAALTPKE